MKKVILIAACVLSLTTVNAQGAAATSPVRKEARQKPTTEQRAQKQTDELNAAVVLTDDQKPKVYDLALNKIKALDAIRLKYKDAQDKTPEGTEMKTVKKEVHNNIRA